MCCHFFPQHSMATCFEFFCLYWQGPVKALWQMSWFKETASAHLQYFTARDHLVLDEKVVGREENATFSQRGGRWELRTQIRCPCQAGLWGSASPSCPGYLSLTAIFASTPTSFGEGHCWCPLLALAEGQVWPETGQLDYFSPRIAAPEKGKWSKK